jgi:hypothetical protein
MFRHISFCVEINRAYRHRRIRTSVRVEPKAAFLCTNVRRNEFWECQLAVKNVRLTRAVATFPRLKSSWLDHKQQIGPLDYVGELNQQTSINSGKIAKYTMASLGKTLVARKLFHLQNVVDFGFGSSHRCRS